MYLRHGFRPYGERGRRRRLDTQLRPCGACRRSLPRADEDIGPYENAGTALRAASGGIVRQAIRKAAAGIPYSPHLRLAFGKQTSIIRENPPC